MAGFVFTVLHPAFNTVAANRCVEIATGPNGREAPIHGIKITKYLHVPAGKGTGMLGEPEPHWYFHRPLHALLGACFAAGFVFNGWEESSFRVADADPRRSAGRPFPTARPSSPRASFRVASHKACVIHPTTASGNPPFPGPKPFLSSLLGKNG